MSSVGGDAVIAETRKITRNEILLEFLMNSLRLKTGFSIELAEERTGLNAAAIREPLKKHVAEGLIIETDNNLRCSDAGYLFLDNILLDLV